MAQTQTSKTKYNVCFVEDSRTAAFPVKKFLGSLDLFSYQHFLNAETALTSLKKKKYDILITDLTLSDTGMNGPELIRTVRSDIRPRINKIPILVTTGSTDEKVFIDVFNAGANDYLLKPLNFTELKNRLFNHAVLEQNSDDVEDTSSNYEDNGRVCLVEDSKTAGLFLTRALHDEGFKIDHFLTAEAGMEALKTGNYNVLLSDMNLDATGMDGDVLVRTLRDSKDPMLAQLPCIIITGDTDAQAIQRVYDAGANDYLAKPVKAKELKARIENMVALNRKTCEKLANTATAQDLSKNEAVTTAATLDKLPDPGLSLESGTKRDTEPLTTESIDIDGGLTLELPESVTETINDHEDHQLTLTLDDLPDDAEPEIDALEIDEPEIDEPEIEIQAKTTNPVVEKSETKTSDDLATVENQTDSNPDDDLDALPDLLDVSELDRLIDEVDELARSEGSHILGESMYQQDTSAKQVTRERANSANIDAKKATPKKPAGKQPKVSKDETPAQPIQQKASFENAPKPKSVAKSKAQSAANKSVDKSAAKSAGKPAAKRTSKKPDSAASAQDEIVISAPPGSEQIVLESPVSARQNVDKSAFTKPDEEPEEEVGAVAKILQQIGGTSSKVFSTASKLIKGTIAITAIGALALGVIFIGKQLDPSWKIPIPLPFDFAKDKVNEPINVSDNSVNDPVDTAVPVETNHNNGAYTDKPVQPLQPVADHTATYQPPSESPAQNTKAAAKHLMLQPLAKRSSASIDSARMPPKKKGLAIAVEAKNRSRGYIDETAQMTLTFVNKQGDERTHVFDYQSMEVAGDEDKTLLIVKTSKDIKGTALLTHNHKGTVDQQWLYIPAIKRVTAISEANRSGSFAGSEFAYEDLTSHAISKFSYKWVRNDQYGGMPCYVIHAYPNAKSGYAYEERWIDKNEFRPMKINYFNSNKKLLKTLTVNKYRSFRGILWRPGAVTMKNHQTGQMTRVQWESHRFAVGLNDANFEQNVMKK